MSTSPDPSFAGRTYPPGPPHRISEAKVREFAQATGFTFDDNTLEVPPTFLVSLAQATEAQYIEDPAAGIDFTRVVHGEESFEYQREVRVGDTLIPTLTVDRVRSAGGHTMVSTRVDMADPQGHPLATVRSMLVVRGSEAS